MVDWRPVSTGGSRRKMRQSPMRRQLLDGRPKGWAGPSGLELSRGYGKSCSKSIRGGSDIELWWPVAHHAMTARLYRTVQSEEARYLNRSEEDSEQKVGRTINVGMSEITVGPVVSALYSNVERCGGRSVVPERTCKIDDYVDTVSALYSNA